MTMNQLRRPALIGIFDSGLGGLSVLQQVGQLLPNEKLLYLADQRYCPYGALPEGVVRERTMAIHNLLSEHAVDVLIAACNTACAVALDDLRAASGVPVIGLEPALKPAVNLSRSRKVLVLATTRTVASDRLRLLVEQWSEDCDVECVAAPSLVGVVERGELSGEVVERELHLLLDAPLQRGVDVIVLGCTHFPFLRPAISAIAGPLVQVVDSGEAIARRAKQVLFDDAVPTTSPSEHPSEHSSLIAMTTGECASFEQSFHALIGDSLPDHRAIFRRVKC